MKKFILFLATKKGFYALEKIVESGFKKNVGMVITFVEKDVEKSYDKDIEMICRKEGIKFLIWNEAKYNLTQYIKYEKITSAVAIGWKYLIDLGINNVLEDNLIVFHDSLLPKYRGFAPTPTAIMCGESRIGVSVIFATETVDEGDIILQQDMIVEESQYINEIIERQGELYSELLLKVFKMISDNKLDSYKQNEDEATYSLWRNIEDCRIDWSETSTEIYNKIRAVSAPFYGAYTEYNGYRIIINRCEKLGKDLNFAIRDCGKIWSIQGNCPIVVCGKGLIKILEAKTLNNDKVIFDKLRIRLK